MGSVPYKDMEKCCQAILQHFPEAPTLPVMTRGVRWMLEGLPCIVFDRERKLILMDPSPEREQEILEFYDRYEAGDLEYFAITKEAAPFFHHMIQRLKEARPPELQWVFYHTAGPVLMGDSLKQLDGRPVFHHETLRDILVKGLNMKTRWMEAKINEVLDIRVAVDMAATSMVNFTSSAGSGSRETIIEAVNEGFAELKGLRWVHCCANIDWSLLMDSRIDVINLDAYQHAENLALYKKEVMDFLDRGGMIGWGIVPVIADQLKQETLRSLVEKLERILDVFVATGIDEELLVSSSWILPSCETVLLTEDESDHVFELTCELSRTMRGKFGFKH